MRQTPVAAVVAVIPARGGSKGLHRKNLQLLAGRPLIVHAIDQALGAATVQRVIVSTDDPEIASIARDAGAETPFLRPAEFATDDATDLEVFQHLLSFLAESEGSVPDVLVQVRATSPVRRSEIIDLAVRKLLATRWADSLRSVSLSPVTPYKMWTVAQQSQLAPVIAAHTAPDWYDQPRQALPDVFVQDGLVDVIRSSTILEQASMAGEAIIGLLHPDPAVDIDDLADLAIAEKILTRDPPRTLSIRQQLGIVQGRLTPSWNGQLQCFPRGAWAAEFGLAAELGLAYIELLIDQRPNPENPMWTQNGRAEVRRTVDRTGVRASAASIDYVIAHDLRAPDTFDSLNTLAPLLAEVGVQVAVLPMFGASELRSPPDPLVVPQLRRIAEMFARHQITLCLESTLPGDELYELLGLLAHHNVAVCYDTGNTTAAGHDIVSDLRLLGPSVRHVHIKDKDSAGHNVTLGSGHTDLRGFLATLARLGYGGGLTMETPRGSDPIRAAARHATLVRELSLAPTGGTIDQGPEGSLG